MKTRYGVPVAGDDRETITAFLDHFREVMIQLCDGLSREDVTRPDADTGFSLLGLIKHLTLAERSWFQERLAGEDIGFVWDPQDPDADFRIEPDEEPAVITDLYRAACNRNREIVAARSLDDPLTAEGYEEYTVRWVVVHMATETARHAGHADLIRERIDGRTGVGYPG